MPNFKLIDSLRKRYANKELIKGFDCNLITDSFKYDKPRISLFATFNFARVFKNREKVEAVLLFIDITSFSKRFESANSDEVSSILDEYYEIVIPIIYEFNGEIEKLIGDGIICVFGKPFLSLQKKELLERAIRCGKKIIRKTYENNLESKIALHFGEIMYYMPPTGEFTEFTMIGKTLTELFRLESESSSNSINYYLNSDFDKYLSDFVPKSPWIRTEPHPISLKGVDFKSIECLKYNPQIKIK